MYDNDPRIEELKDFLFKKKLGVWTIKDIIAKVRELYLKESKNGNETF